jgi:SAM-dependent methyltransferase
MNKNSHSQIDINNRVIFRKKKLLQLIYYDYFRQIKKNLYLKSNYPSLEIGSSGFIKDIIPKCITSNLVKNDFMIDRVENVYKLGERKEKFSNIIMVDIFHHLEFPMVAIKNLHKILCQNGRVILVEPAMGLIPRLIYKFFHHEPNGFNLKIDTKEELDEIQNESQYFAAQALSWRVFVKNEINYNKFFDIKMINHFSDFAYLGSGGFSYKGMYPEKLYPIIKKLDNILTKLSKYIFSSRMIIVLEKKI